MFCRHILPESRHDKTEFPESLYDEIYQKSKDFSKIKVSKIGQENFNNPLYDDDPEYTSQQDVMDILNNHLDDNDECPF